MNKENLRERNQKQKTEPKVDRNQVKKESEKQAPRKSSWCSYCVIITLFFLPLIFLPIVPYLRIDPTIEAHYIKLAESPKFEGNLKENNLLQDAQYFAKGKLVGPETVIFVNDTMYTGLSNGQLVRVDENGDVHFVAQIGDASQESCKPVKHSNKECGRPLGLRYKSGFIYMADGYLGIYKVDLKTNKKYPVIVYNDKRFDKPIKLIDDLDIDDEDNIYFTVSSRKRELHEAVELHLEAIPDGRVFRYNERTNDITLLMDDMIFPNGIQLTPNKDALIIAEHGFARLIKYHLKGSKQGQHEVLANLPGFPDNIRISDRNTLYVAFALTRNPKPYRTSLLDLLGEYPSIRTFLGKTISLEKAILAAPKYALAAEYDFNGNLLRSWHDPTGERIEIVTCITEHKKKLYLGSYIHDYIAVVDY